MEEIKNENEEKKDDLFLNWYRDNLNSIEKGQSNYFKALIVFSLFALTIVGSKESTMTVPFIDFKIDMVPTYRFLPLLISLVYWAYLGSMRAARISSDLLVDELKRLGYDEKKFSLYNSTTSMYLPDFIQINFKTSYKFQKRFDIRQFTYLLIPVFIFYTKIECFFEYPVSCSFKIIFVIAFILDIAFSFQLFKNRFEHFFYGHRRNNSG